ncbi:hypothetical protein [Dechloromonas denitrificans]|uniref:hypothetical protein n=1 Tax=Dechloromonas denitrificans TaxID=281362 RepID=UPI001CF91AA3|nr:hypothetical protein [Dechloromonas denitrificans]UCV02288.1 hypothetical protein KI611_14475 [Dechloromonas denitrificans]
MTPEQARAFAEGLLAAADQAEMEGRNLTEADLDHFAEMDNAARAELAAAIARYQA